MKSPAPSLLPILRSPTQGRILSTVLADTTERSITQLADLAHTSVPTVIREIDRAEDAGLVTSHRVGNLRLVHANTAHPLHEPLRQILTTTFGPPAVIAEEFAHLDHCDQILIHGSWAARYHGEPGKPPADIDVLIIGTPDRDQVDDAADAAQARLAMPVQATIRTPTQWADATDPFLTHVRERPTLTVLTTDTTPGEHP